MCRMRVPLSCPFDVRVPLLAIFIDPLISFFLLFRGDRVSLRPAGKGVGRVRHEDHDSLRGKVRAAFCAGSRPQLPVDTLRSTSDISKEILATTSRTHRGSCFLVAIIDRTHFTPQQTFKPDQKASFLKLLNLPATHASQRESSNDSTGDAASHKRRRDALVREKAKRVKDDRSSDDDSQSSSAAASGDEWGDKVTPFDHRSINTSMWKGSKEVFMTNTVTQLAIRFILRLMFTS